MYAVGGNCLQKPHAKMCISEEKGTKMLMNFHEGSFFKIHKLLQEWGELVNGRMEEWESERMERFVYP